MKKTILILMLITVSFADALAQNDVMYVYRNDGVINAFLKEKIDSIVCSQIDLDSLAHSEYVVQEVWAVDSVYRIPLEVIDSVSFVTPKTVYQPGTVNLTAEMRDYIVSSDSLVLVFGNNTPAGLLPKVGDKLVNTEGSGGLYSGFLGKVKDIGKTSEGYVIKCDAIGITDVFECYYGVSHGEVQQGTRGIGDGYYPLGFIWEPGRADISLLSMFGSAISYEPDGNTLVPSVDAAVSTVSLTPRIQSFSYLIVNKDYGVNMSVGLYGDYTLEEYLSLSGRVSGGGDVKLYDKIVYKCSRLLLDVTLEAGVFLRGDFQVSTEQKWKQRYRSAFHWEYSSRGQQSVKNVNEIRNVENSHSGILALKGIYEAGLYVNIGIAFVATNQLDIAEVGVRLEGGGHFDGTALPYLSNKEDAMRSPDLYNMMKGQGVELSLYYGTSIYTKMFGWTGNIPIPDNFLNIPFGKKHVWKSCYYVPEFQNTKLEKDSEGNYFASTEIHGNCGTTDIGFSLQSKESYSDKVDGYCVYDYNGPSASAYSTFYTKPSKEPVIVYPLVKFGDLEMIAEPSAEMPVHTCPDDHHPHAIDLGLPSGTKWCCCNVGAVRPEAYGGYYAWGETSEKSVYNWETYAYGSNWDDCVSLGADISGTQYDVAHVRMGVPWVMPSKEQQDELRKYCTQEWTSVNGVNGILVTGSNGGQIFLPAGGFRWDDGLYYAGSGGYYWSSTQYPDYSYGAYGLDFYSGYWLWGHNYRNDGHSVRAVCP